MPGTPLPRHPDGCYVVTRPAVRAWRAIYSARCPHAKGIHAEITFTANNADEAWAWAREFVIIPRMVVVSVTEVLANGDAGDLEILAGKAGGE
jgi:hypothetical protein